LHQFHRIKKDLISVKKGKTMSDPKTIKNFPRRTFLKQIGASMGAGVVLSGLPNLSFAQGVIKWRYYSYTPPLHHYTKLLVEMAKEVARRTNNRLQITVVTAGEVPYNPTESLNIVRDRFVDGGEAVTDFVAGSIPILNLTNLPMLITSLKELDQGAKVFEPFVKHELQGMKQELLFRHFASVKVFFGRGKPVEKLSDLKGRRIRAFGLTDSQFVRLLGAVPVAFPNTEVAQAMQRGVMDGFIASAQFTVGSKWDQLIQWGYLLEFSVINVYDTANQAAIQALPPDVKKILFEVAAEYKEKWDTVIPQLESGARAKMQKDKIKLVSASAGDKTEAQKLAVPYWSQWAKSVGPNAVKALQEVRKAVGK
jgi:TRAP-type transport system periplasmic protein